MKKPIKTYDTFEIVVVPFPFIDTAETKHRPAIILSSANNFGNQAGASLLAMITSSTHAPWPCDVDITDLASAGLPVRSLIRMKLFTLDHRLILKRIGMLGAKDQKALTSKLKRVLNLH